MKWSSYFFHDKRKWLLLHLKRRWLIIQPLKHFIIAMGSMPSLFFILLKTHKPETVISWLFIFAQLCNVLLWEHQSWSRNLILKDFEMQACCMMKGHTDLHAFQRQGCDWRLMGLIFSCPCCEINLSGYTVTPGTDSDHSQWLAWSRDFCLRNKKFQLASCTELGL